MYWLSDEDKYSRSLSSENGREIYYEIMCDALLQVTGNLIHSAFKNKKQKIKQKTKNNKNWRIYQLW